ncbi:hypothetical protein CSUI_006125 [Cystoisospora suis]|uniref:Dynein assembly factor 3, axonemal n=1 Tax=Cystoisospora suis TaxID=483139 RepID=A0A2C6KV58_9APIC|nr:hypothetical protein CSUI_006125 [Cystoisospora suis]
MATDVSSGLGFVRFWASAPALDICKVLKQHGVEPPRDNGPQPAKHGCDGPNDGCRGPGEATENKPGEDDKAVNVLLLGLGDLHHVLLTASRLWKHERRSAQLHFFIHEEAAEVLARHVLLLDVINDTALSLRDRTEAFLDIYANCRLLSKTAANIQQRQAYLTDFVCGERFHRLSNLLDLSHLKHRQRDEIQEAIETWHTLIKFDVDTLRDQRLRHCYAERYDFKVNLMDWNYQMNLAPSASIIHWRQYKRFALTGIAFDARLAEQTEPNRTLASYTAATDKKRGQSVKVRGFWGDIVNGPFCAYGVETRQCYKDRLFRKINQQHRYHTQDIATFNLTSIIYGLQEEQELSLPQQADGEDKPPYPTPTELAFLALESQKKSARSEATKPEDSPEESTKSTRAGTPGKESDSGLEEPLTHTASQEILENDPPRQKGSEEGLEEESRESTRSLDYSDRTDPPSDKQPTSSDSGAAVGDGPADAGKTTDTRKAGDVPLPTDKLLRGKVVRAALCSVAHV